MYKFTRTPPRTIAESVAAHSAMSEFEAKVGLPPTQVLATIQTELKMTMLWRSLSFNLVIYSCAQIFRERNHRRSDYADLELLQRSTVVCILLL